MCGLAVGIASTARTQINQLVLGAYTQLMPGHVCRQKLFTIKLDYFSAKAGLRIWCQLFGIRNVTTVRYNDRIFLTGAIRRDDASTFGVDAEAQTYPKLSGTWVVSEESFWNIDFINSMRVRGAWGRAPRRVQAEGPAMALGQPRRGRLEGAYPRRGDPSSN